MGISSGIHRWPLPGLGCRHLDRSGGAFRVGGRDRECDERLIGRCCEMCGVDVGYVMAVIIVTTIPIIIVRGCTCVVIIILVVSVHGQGHGRGQFGVESFVSASYYVVEVGHRIPDCCHP